MLRRLATLGVKQAHEAVLYDLARMSLALRKEKYNL